MKKLYYSIGEVADLFKVNTTLIRYWEKEFDILSPERDSKGNRIYREEDLTLFRSVYHLLKVRKMTIEGARQYLKSNTEEAAARMKAVETLKNIRKELLDIKKEIQDENQ